MKTIQQEFCMMKFNGNFSKLILALALSLGSKAIFCENYDEVPLERQIEAAENSLKEVKKKFQAELAKDGDKGLEYSALVESAKKLKMQISKLKTSQVESSVGAACSDPAKQIELQALRFDAEQNPEFGKKLEVLQEKIEKQFGLKKSEISDELEKSLIGKKVCIDKDKSKGSASAIEYVKMFFTVEENLLTKDTMKRKGLRDLSEDAKLMLEFEGELTSTSESVSTDYAQKIQLLKSSKAEKLKNRYDSLIKTYSEELKKLETQIDAIEKPYLEGKSEYTEAKKTVEELKKSKSSGSWTGPKAVGITFAVLTMVALLNSFLGQKSTKGVYRQALMRGVPRYSPYTVKPKRRSISDRVGAY